MMQGVAENMGKKQHIQLAISAIVTFDGMVKT